MIQVFKLSETVGFLLSPVDVEVAAHLERVRVLEVRVGFFGLIVGLVTHERKKSLAGVLAHQDAGHLAVLAAELHQLFLSLISGDAGQVLDVEVVGVHFGSLGLGLEGAEFHGGALVFQGFLGQGLFGGLLVFELHVAVAAAVALIVQRKFGREDGAEVFEEVFEVLFGGLGRDVLDEEVEFPLKFL